jgi:predicted transposase YbfD/YdcC
LSVFLIYLIAELIGVNAVKGCVATADAMNCQKTIAVQIRKRRLSLNLLCRDMSEKGGIQIKRLKAPLNEDYPRRILNS